MNSSTPFFKLSALAVAVVTTITLAACGGGGGSSNSASSGGTAGASSYSGTVSGLGSIVVNGVRFSTTGATTADEDNPDQPFAKAFGLGTTVTVTGTVNSDGVTGTATSVVVHGGVRGQVTAVDVAHNTFTVSGQTVTVDTNTVFDGTTTGFGLSTLVANTTFVEVYGVYDSATGTVKASRVEEETNAGVAALGFAVKGLVSNLDTTGHTFDLTLRSGVIAHVAYTADANVKPTGATLANGADVRILMDQTNANALAAASSGTVNVTATKVLVKRNKQADGSVAKLQGAILTISSDRNTWTIGDATIDVSQSPELEGVNLATITAGTVVKVKGSFVNGVLVAKSIESDGFERSQPDGGVKLFGAVSAVDSTSTPNTFTVQGVKVTMGGSTVGSLPAQGTYVEVLARPDSNGVLTAVRIGTQAGGEAPRSFELFGTAPCTAGQSDLAGAFTLALRDGSLPVDGSAATFNVGSRVDMTASNTTEMCVLEVKGSMTTVNNVKTLKASVIEVLKRAASVTLR